MGVAGSVFEPQPCNFAKLDYFRDVQMILLSYLAISKIDRLEKNIKKQGVQVIPRSTLSCLLSSVESVVKSH